MPTTQAALITPAVLEEHGIIPEEFERIKNALGREPSLTELGIFSVMWSEHCSYKSSRVHLKRLPTRSSRVVQGPGENAGIIDIGDGWACAFKIESHNHPSFIEPFQGAATGVGGILRDIFTMGARPLAVMDSLRFGPITPAKDQDQGTVHRNHSILEGVVSGIASYGNCFGVPNLGGETKFESCYSQNPLVNAFALGLVRRDQIFYARAAGEGNPVIYVGAKTGRDGIHGATMASEEFTQGSEQKRPNVQVGDPFLEKLLLEACLEAMQTGAVVGIQDMGAAGLTCSTCEMGSRGGVGLEIEIDRVPQRETGMNAYEIMLSESQERMLLVAESGREGEVFRVFEKWGLDAVIIGHVTNTGRLCVREHGEVVADIPNSALTDDAPLYHRPLERWEPPVSRVKPDHIALKRAGDFTADLKRLLASPNICSKRWIFEQYDSMVQSNTVEGPGADAGLMRIKGTQRALAMALDGNGRWCWHARCGRVCAQRLLHRRCSSGRY
jgi:phosphoribosylformylglycinamidine synthase II